MDTEQIAEEKLIKIANTDDLHTAIARLKTKAALQEEGIKDQFHDILVSLKPGNILKQTVHEVQENPKLKGGLFKLALGLGAGYFSRKMVVGSSAGIVKRALGAALQYGITQVIATKHTEPEDETGTTTPKKKKNLLKRILAI